MILTKEDLNAIGDLIDRKVEPKFQAIDRRFEAIDRRFEAIDKRFEAIDRRFEAIDERFEEVNKKIDLIVDHLNLTEVFENSKGVSLGLAKKIHQPKKRKLL